jgi:sec-independent protein translocase protein TatC
VNVSTEVAPTRADGSMTLFEHLAELRHRIIICVVAVGIGMVFGFLLYDWVFAFLVHPYKEIAQSNANVLGNGKLLQIDPLEGFGIRMKTSVYAGIAFAMPVLLWQIWRFVTPGLYPNERRYIIPFVLSAMALFVMGAGLAYYTMPRALQFLIQIGGKDLVTAFAPGKYFQLIVYMMLAFGVGFEFPIILVFLQMAGIVPTAALKRVRRYAIVGICIVVAVITPSGDPISMLMLTIPMCVFYEVAIIVGGLITRRQAAARAEE